MDPTAQPNIVAAAPQQAPLTAPDLATNALPLTNGLASGGQPTAPQGITADEIALYDRQIRLWGMQAQEKIRSANVLLITMRALGNEVAKNLVLAGIGSLTIVDHEVATEADLGAQFFLSAEEGHLGMNRALAASAAVQRLNPRVRVRVDQEDIRAKGPSFFAPFDVVIATDLHPETLNVINTATRLMSRPFYAAGTHGLYGFIFNDLIEHDYVITRDRPNVPTELRPESRTRAVVAVQTREESGGRAVETVTKRELYSTWFLASDAAGLPDEFARSPRRLRAVTPALPCLRALWQFQQAHDRLPGRGREDLQEFTMLAHQKHTALGLPAGTLRAEFLRSFVQNIGSELAAVAAIVGGQLAQDVINVLGHTQQPIQNMVVFDGNTIEGLMYPLHPDGQLGSRLLPASAAAGIVGAGISNGAAGVGMVAVPSAIVVDPAQARLAGPLLGIPGPGPI